MCVINVRHVEQGVMAAHVNCPVVDYNMKRNLYLSVRKRGFYRKCVKTCADVPVGDTK